MGVRTSLLLQSDQARASTHKNESQLLPTGQALIQVISGAMSDGSATRTFQANPSAAALYFRVADHPPATHSSREYTAGRIDLRLFAFVQTKGPKEQSISAPRRRNGSHQYPRSHFRVAFQKEQWHTPVDSQKEEA